MPQVSRMRSLAPLALTCVCALLCASCQTPLASLLGTSVYCGDPSQVSFHYARFAYRDADLSVAQPVWSSSKKVLVGDPIGVDGAALRDLRLVSRGGGSTGVSIQGTPVGSVGDNRQSSGGSGGGGSWELRVLLTSDGADRLRSVASEVAGSYTILALLVGGKVFAASVDLDVSGGIARIEPTTPRSSSSASEFFRLALGCSPGDDSAD